jgi:acetyl-CoA acetyltransferase
MTNYYRRDLFASEGFACTAALYENAGIAPSDIDVALIYDAFSFQVLVGLEEYGFCKPGDAADFVRSGGIEGPEGLLPVNTHGGSLSEAYVHGFNHILEAVRQIRGTSTSQVPNAEVALVTSASFNPTSAMILRR